MHLEKPSMYRVLVHHDGETPLAFVEHILRKFFRMNEHIAQNAVLRLRDSGQSVCGIYHYEIAEAKASEVIEYSQARGWSLKLSLERQFGD